jgi:hypothetical protein
MEESQRCTMLVRGWDFSFSFSTSVPSFQRGPYWDHSQLVITGRLIEPTLAKVTGFEMIIAAIIDLDRKC